MARRGSALVGAAGLLVGVGTSALPSLVSADALNPLTERSLTLSSSSPGWSFTDGSGNPTYAYPNSGANGQKTGNTFDFKVSSNATIKGFTFQYCTAPAGNCTAPGDDAYISGSPDTRGADTSSTSDLKVATATPTEISSGDWTTISASASKVPLADNSQGNFVVIANGAYSSGWSMTAVNLETGTVAAHTATGKANYIKLTNSGGQALTPGQAVKVIFFATDTNYITNPGSGAFFVKINDYNDDTTLDDTTLVDGGVTVANVMNQSIAIQTKVLETMDFSVGTVDPDTLTAGSGNELDTATSGARTAHGQCDPVLMALDPSDPQNTLYLGDANAEDSLRTDTTFAVHSYWRLSSNSSGGATVYYTGSTLSNTEGDQIAPIGNTAAAPLTGTEQFGIGIANDTTANHFYVDATTNTDPDERGADNGTAFNGALDSTAGTGWLAYQAAHSTLSHNPQLFPLVADPEYDGGVGAINGSPTSSFSFDPNANTVPRAIASENTQVVDCVTAKMRYIANIAATTPAGIYTTKINYVASPQY